MTGKELRTLDEMLTNLEIWSTWNKTFANEMIGICSKMRNLLADRKTENNSEIPNNCEELNAYRKCVESRSFWDSKHCDGCYFDERCPFDEPKDEPQKKEVEWVYNKRERLWYPYSNGELLFKTEPTTEDCSMVDKDINVRSKDEPQTDIHGLTDCDFCKEKNCEDCEGGKDEPQSGCCNECKWYGDKQVCGRCRSRNLYAPKDEPQTEVYKCPKCGKDTPIEFDECVWCLSPKDEPLTKCDLCKREGDDICLDCERKKQSGKE